MADQPIVALAGAGGDLGDRIARALVARGAHVRTLVRPGLKPDERMRIEALGAEAVPAHPANAESQRSPARSRAIAIARNGSAAWARSGS